MEQSITRSSRVLLICSERYVEKANSGIGGVGYEKMIVTADLVTRIESKKAIPIIRQRGIATLPTFLSSKTYIDLSTDDKFETGFDQLLRDLLNAPLFQKPPLGIAPTLATAAEPIPTLSDPLTQFMIALSSIYDRSGSAGEMRAEWVLEKMNVSKLMFDHAIDLAKKNDFIHVTSNKEIMWVLPAGREHMLKL